MCKPTFIDAPFTPADMRFLSFSKNFYGVTGNLKGCENDTKGFEDLWLAHFPRCDFRKYMGGYCTVDNYKHAVSQSIATLEPGATVIVISDSCYSETITRGHNPSVRYEGRKVRNRFLPNPSVPRGVILPRVNRVYKPKDSRWMVISACQEEQTAADAHFTPPNKYYGALSFSLIYAFRPEYTWAQWFNAAQQFVKKLGFSQVPILEDKINHSVDKIGSKQTLIIHNSSHGTQVPDWSGDELDGLDEALVFDKILLDDDINVILSKII